MGKYWGLCIPLTYKRNIKKMKIESTATLIFDPRSQISTGSEPVQEVLHAQEVQEFCLHTQIHKDRQTKVKKIYGEKNKRIQDRQEAFRKRKHPYICDL